MQGTPIPYTPMQELAPPTQHIMRQIKYSEFSILFQGKSNACLDLWCCIFSGVGKRNPAPLIYCLSRQDWQRGVKDMPPAALFEIVLSTTFK